MDSRREFLKASVVGAIALSSGALFAKESKHDRVVKENEAKTLPSRILGKDLKVSALGLGCMGMSHGHGPAHDEKEMIKLIHKAIELGVTYFDTAEIYGPHTNEILLGKALKPYRDKVIIGTKFGLYYPFSKQHQDSSKKAILRAVDGSLKCLNTDFIDLYTQHRVDPDTPIEEVANTMSELVKMGKIRYYGLSEPSAKTIERAHKIYPVTSVQNHYSMMFREVEDNKNLATCEKLGIGFTAYSPLERGFLGGLMDENTTFHKTLDMRAAFPRFQKDALRENQKILNYVREIAKSKIINGKSATTAQISLAWLLAQKPFIMPIPETTKIAHLEENLGALEIGFERDELEAIDKALKAMPVFGERYPPNSDAARSVGL
ncbi:aldo/keto reductase [Helicobacter burdigaliensis]|uniref:aldo/keto reductase n=1 Tax=Helicobacter burdigaliensis TaxID=2315334 RepID=UPI000EF672F2|nr:aldo/keto reductase [Helicobacter burdigaliensis]